MIPLGTFQSLTILRFTSVGAYVGGKAPDGSDYEVLLPNNQLAPNFKEGGIVGVFIYVDSADRPIATLKRPKVVVNEYAFLKCVMNTSVGSFFDWGLERDLLVPFGEQRMPLKEGQSYVIHLKHDEVSQRLIGSAKVKKYLNEDTSALKVGQAVDMLAFGIDERGALVILDNTYAAYLPTTEAFRRVSIGDRVRGFVKQVREDGKVSVSLNPQGFSAVAERAPTVLDLLKREGGFLPLSDNSSPEEIRRVFGMSKGAYKKLIGNLMREGKIEIEYHGIRLKEQQS